MSVENKSTIVQKINKTFVDSMDIAIVYYSILSTLGGWQLTEKQVQLLAFTAIRGTITPKSARQEFVQKYNSSLASVENLKGELVKKSLLVKDDNMYRVNQKICPNFDNHMNINLLLLNKEENGQA